MNTNEPEMNGLVARADKLISAVTTAIMSTIEAGAERLELASRVAVIQGRMAAFGAVLQSVSTAKTALLAQLDKAPTLALRALMEAQVAALAEQELAILDRAGVPQQVASAALAAVDAGNGVGGADDVADARGVAGPPTHRRDGRRFVPVAGLAGGNGEGERCGVSGAVRLWAASRW